MATYAELIVECDGWCGQSERIGMGRSAHGHEGYEPDGDPALVLYPFGSREYCADCMIRAQREAREFNERAAQRKERREARRDAGE